MNEIPEGFEIVEVKAWEFLESEDILGALNIQIKDDTVCLFTKCNHLVSDNYTTIRIALAAANYRVLRKKTPPEPVVIECEITVPFESYDTIDTYGLYKMLRAHPGKRFNAVLTEIQEQK